MEDKKILYIIGIIVIVLLIGGAVGLLFYLQKPKDININQPLTEPTNTNQAGSLPTTPTTPTLPGQETELAKLAKEKQFISSYYQPIEINIPNQFPTYQLPITDIKEKIINYRDFSRKIDIEAALPQLANNGLISISNPFATKPTDWQNAYSVIKEKNVPILITSDSLTGLYQDTLRIIYKEIEQENFYPSLWQLLKEMFNQTKSRYETKKQKFGIETDLATEANRLELAYLSVALKLMAAEPGQIKDSLTVEKKFFTPQEASIYTFQVPAYLENEVNQEIKLISSKTKKAKSPIFLYDQSYEQYAIPVQYQTSEKLKNYYLTISWLNNSLFPLWSKSDDCPDCLLDEQDQAINFIAASYLSDDLASNQNRKNRWANIYKTISFFRGLEVNLTYLEYQFALEEIFGPDYDLDEIWQTDLTTIKENIKKLQAKISSFEFFRILSSTQDLKQNTGLRLLRDHYLLENKIFTLLTNPATGAYLKDLAKDEKPPFTVCSQQKILYRCWSTGLDIFNLLKNKTAQQILTETGDDQYQNYSRNLAGLEVKLEEFNQQTWHENAYLSLLTALTSLDSNNDIWAKRSLNTSLAAWTDFHRQISFEKTTPEEDSGLQPYFDYGFIEPQPKFYAQLLANVRMIKDGFLALQIIDQRTKSFERLTNLELVLDKTIEISQKELINQTLDSGDYNFINNFEQKIKLITGDIKKENLKNIYTFSYQLTDKEILNEYIDGLNYLIIIYPDSEGKLLFALGPVFNYTEGKNRKRIPADWQKDFEL